MRIVEFKAQVTQRAGLRLGAEYQPDVPYIVSDKFAEALTAFAGFKSQRLFDLDRPWPWTADHHATAGLVRKAVIHSVGGLGDYVALLHALLTFQARFPRIELDVVTERIGYDLLRCGGFRGDRVPFPFRLQDAARYDAILFIEDVTEHPRFREWDLADLFADYLGVTGPLLRPIFQAGDAARQRMKLAVTTRRRVGVQLCGSSPLRSVPADRLRPLLRGLVRQGWEVHLLGEAGSCDAPSASPLFANWCGRTPAIEDLIALVEQMDALIAPDSFLVHLGGAMKIPTLGLFTVVPAALRVERYPSVQAVEPRIGCNPCFGRKTCPLGHDHCLVWDEPAMSAGSIFDRVNVMTASAVSV